MPEVSIKPLSVNEAWQGRRFKTKKHKAYREQLQLLLPSTVHVPEGRIEARYTFNVSNTQSDYDNLIKAFQDALCDKYGFDDSRIYRAIIEKNLVKKGQESIHFELWPVNVMCGTCWLEHGSPECQGDHAAENGYS